MQRNNLDLTEPTGEAFLQVGKIVKNVFGDLLFGFGCSTHPLAVCYRKNCCTQLCGNRRNKYSTGAGVKLEELPWLWGIPSGKESSGALAMCEMIAPIRRSLMCAGNLVDLTATEGFTLL